MSAGSGVSHSEFNASKDEPVHFLQIWLVPTDKGIDPSYEQKAYSDQDKRGRLRLVASPDAREGSLTIHSDARLYAGIFGASERAELPLEKGRHAYVHVARGKLRVNGQELAAGDGAALSDEAELLVEGLADGGEALVFDLA
jgi:redox-sensitive bicupin YhaK (pirin superfamily)